MGEIAEMMLEGILCEGCGGVVDGKATGYARRCRSCGPAISLQQALKRPLHPEHTSNGRKAARHNRERHAEARSRKPFECSKCRRLFRTEGGLKQHSKDVHEKPRAVQP